MVVERRRAARVSLPSDIEAYVSGIAVSVVNLSAIGVLFEHSDRLPTVGARLELRWRDVCAEAGMRFTRTSIVGRSGAQLIYQTAAHFTDTDPMSEGAIASILRAGESSRQTTTVDEPSAAIPPDEDTWTRTVNFLAGDQDDDLPYVRFRKTASGWTKEYVASTAQPEDGFTIVRSANCLEEALVLQRAFEKADGAGRRKLQLRIEAMLLSSEHQRATAPDSKPRPDHDKSRTR